MVLIDLLLASVATMGTALPQGGAAPDSSSAFTFRPHLADPPSLAVEDPVVTGTEVLISGGDARRPRRPFTVDWGDGTGEEGFFPFRHRYGDGTRDYVVTVIAHYDPGEATETVRVRFTPARFPFVRDPAVARRVRVADRPVRLGTTLPGHAPPAELTGFRDEELAVPRAAWEYLLDVGHHVQLDLCNGDVEGGGRPELVVLGHPGFPGAYSLWYTRPVAMAAEPSYLRRLDGISSLLHELAHDLTLNSPARFRLGGHTDGAGSTIVSETLAQILQHATAWEILNRPGRYGLGAELAAELRHSALAAFAVTARAHRDYLAAGHPFASWRTGESEGDPTMGTFMTLAYEFVRLAEDRGAFREPARRSMALLQTFREEDRARYQQRANDSFRATFLVAALSHGFDLDLRENFRDLGFPLDDAAYHELRARGEGGN